MMITFELWFSDHFSFWLQLQSIVNDLEENKELAASRMEDLEKLQEKHQDVIKELEQCKLNVSWQLVWQCIVLPNTSFQQAVYWHWLPEFTSKILCLRE